MTASKRSWLTRPLFTTPSRVARALNVAAGVMVVLFVVSPALVSWAWHLRHGNIIECRGNPVFVPPRWIADIDDGNDAHLSRLPFFIPIGNLDGFDEATVFVGKSPFAPHENVGDMESSRESVFWSLHQDMGEVVSGPIKVGSGPNEAVCMIGNQPHADWSSASCLTLSSKWTADFMGEKKDMEDFFTVIRKLN